MFPIDSGPFVHRARSSSPPSSSLGIFRTALLLRNIILVLATLLALSAAASADMPKAPSAPALQAQLSVKLPPYWKVAEVTIEASANYGNAVEPEFKQRVVARIEPTDNLYVSAGKIGNMKLLARSMKADDTRKLYLIATSTLRAGTWHTTFDQQNDPTAGAGKPRSFFTGAAVVQGSPKEAAYRKQLADEAAARQQAHLAAIARQQAIAAAKAKGQVEKAQQAAALQAAHAKAAEEEAARRHATFETSLKAIETNAGNLLKADLPAYWQIKRFTLTAPADVTLKAALAPHALVRQRFVATIVLTHDTFVVAKTGRITLLRSALTAGTERKLDGVVESVQGPEGWRSKLTMGAPAAYTNGKPRSYYPATAIVQGSPEQAAYKKQRADEAAARQQAELAAIARQQAIAAAKAKGQVEKAQQAAALQAAKDKAAKQEAAHRHAAFEASLKAIKANAGNLLRVKLPAYWKIKALTLTPPADVTEQAYLAPHAVVRQRFTATVALTEDTFAASKKRPMTILHPVLKTGAERKLDGTLQSVRASEGWRSKLDISNPIGAADGRPQAYYDGNALVAGSPKEVAYRKRQAAILRAGAIPPGTYKAGSKPYVTTCHVTDMHRSDGRIRSFFTCRDNNGPWNASFMSGPVNSENPFFSILRKAGIDRHLKDYTWGQVGAGTFSSCIEGGNYDVHTLIRARLHGRLLLLSPLYEGKLQCDVAFTRTGDTSNSDESQ